MRGAHLVVTQVLCLILLTGSVYGIFGRNSFPGTQLFALLSLAVSSYAGGCFVKCFKLPPLLGMLTVGVLFRNLSFITFTKNIPTNTASILRDISLAIILLKAGLGLDSEKLRVLKMVVFRLSFMPCLFEAICSAVFSHYLLGLPWVWALMLGFILSAVSAAVLVPGALSLEAGRLGTDKGVPTLLMASVSLDNIAALTGFIVVFNVLTSEANMTWTFCKRLVEPVVGLVLGSLTGMLLWYFPDPEKLDRSSLTYFRTVLLCLGGLAFTFVSKRLDMSGVGALGCVSLAYFASLRWKNDADHFLSVTWFTGVMWLLIEPFLFGLIGAEVTLQSLKNNSGYGTLVVVLGVCVRIVCTVMALIGSQLNIREKIFVSLSWMSKATVQAAVASQALDFGRTEEKGKQFLEYGNQVLTVSVLSILLTAPLGAAFMDLLGHRLLKRQVTYQPLPGVEVAKDYGVPKIEVTSSYGSCSRMGDQASGSFAEDEVQRTRIHNL